MRVIVAIDGPAASGKGTLARRLAEHYGLPHLDTGLLYRATARTLIDEGRRLDDVAAAVKAARGLALIDFDEAALRGREMGEAASVVAALPEVRAALVQAQQSFARRIGGAVLDGRDIGTVICPDATVKIFVTASPETRAQRRALELRSRGESSDYAKVLADILHRDRRDSSRATAPLKPAADAMILDTTDLDVEGTFREAQRLVEKQLDAKEARRLRSAVP
ncbi:MAG TPA: (d)CMP kinase [Beijerinckiaceae bacterium]|nr:(d)CMP kinase [Beijerinckiaceae bacterium]